MTRTEYRVTWRRPHWRRTSSAHSRHLQLEHQVGAFVRRLRARGPLSELTVEVRDVGPWRAR